MTTGAADLEILELVDGELRQPIEARDAWLTHPDSGERIGQQLASSPAAVEAALAVAQRVHEDGGWMRMPAAERLERMARFADVLAGLADELALADSIDSGTPLSSTRAIAAGSAGLPRALTEFASGLLYAEVETSHGPSDQYWLPWGPAAGFIPWNAPLAVAVNKAASALAVGAPIILKPSEWAPHSTSILARAAAAAGLPNGVLQVIQGGADVGQAIAADPRIAAISFTGGVSGGRAVARESARFLRPVDLELSGCNPVVVLEGADVSYAGTLIADAMRTFNGQWCSGPGRVFAPAAMAEPLADAILAAHDRATVVGSILDESTNLGPMAHEGHLARLSEQIGAFAAAGSEVRTAASLPPLAGHFQLPTVIMNPPDELNRQEIFGPVVTVSGCADVEDAVRRANDHDFGLTGYVIAADRDQARAVGRRLRAAYVYINDIGYHWLHPEMVVSMWGNSGVGTVSAIDGLRFYTGARFVG